MNTAHNPEKMSNPGHCVTMTETNRALDLRHEFVTDFYTGIEKGWSPRTMQELSADICKLTAMLPSWAR